MERMFKHKLELASDVVGNDLTTAEQLIRVLNSPCYRNKELASPEQTAPDVFHCSYQELSRLELLFPWSKDVAVQSSRVPRKIYLET
ncbi:hypothetical protein Tco_1388138 [Tanacetum coccineum]